MKSSIPELRTYHLSTLNSMMKHRPPEFMTFDDLPRSSREWIYEGLANERQLLKVRDQFGPYTDLFMGEIPHRVDGTISVVAVSRRSMLVTKA
jgi:hypothetical protein